MLKEYPPSHISKTIIEMIDLPYVKGNSISFTLINEEKDWKGATLFISYNDKVISLSQVQINSLLTDM